MNRLLLGGMVLLVVLIVMLVIILWTMKDQPKKKHSKQKQQPIKTRTPIIASDANIHALKVQYDVKMHIGARQQQQDACRALDGFDPSLSVDFIGVLCDGMGGLSDGALASQEAVDRMMQRLKRAEPPYNEALITAVKEVNEAIYELAHQQGGGMGTTLLAIIILGSYLYYVSIGDSRIYLLRDHRLVQITTDHNYMLQCLTEVMAGEQDRYEALKNKDGEKLISFVGMQDLNCIDVNIKPLALKPNDKIVLCSDGLYNSLSQEAILNLMASAPNGQLASVLVQQALKQKNPHQDNVSVIGITYRGE